MSDNDGNAVEGRHAPRWGRTTVAACEDRFVDLIPPVCDPPLLRVSAHAKGGGGKGRKGSGADKNVDGWGARARAGLPIATAPDAGSFEHGEHGTHARPAIPHVRPGGALTTVLCACRVYGPRGRRSRRPLSIALRACSGVVHVDADDCTWWEELAGDGQGAYRFIRDEHPQAPDASAMSMRSLMMTGYIVS